MAKNINTDQSEINDLIELVMKRAQDEGLHHVFISHKDILDCIHDNNINKLRHAMTIPLKSAGIDARFNIKGYNFTLASSIFFL